jgi:hypothetical protein
VNEKILTSFLDAPYLDLYFDLHQQFSAKYDANLEFSSYQHPSNYHPKTIENKRVNIPLSRSIKIEKTVGTPISNNPSPKDNKIMFAFLIKDPK